jgi:hypothetical protein
VKRLVDPFFRVVELPDHPRLQADFWYQLFFWRGKGNILIDKDQVFLIAVIR